MKFLNLKNEPSEDDIQKSVIQWCNYHPIIREFHFHIPNGGSRNIIEARKLKLMGVQKGVLDLCFPLPQKGFHGMYLELKSKSGRLTKDQEIWIEKLRAVGYYVEIARSIDESIEIIENYLE